MTEHTTGISFFFVDVFAEEPLTGNPLALVPDADGLSEARMQAIAREFNQSETTFIVRPTTPSAGWRLRSFTPAGVEVFGAGHNAMGAWLWLALSGALPEDRHEFVQQIGPDLLPVEVSWSGAGGADAATTAAVTRPTVTRPTVTRPTVTMDQSEPTFGAVFDDVDALAAALRLETGEVAHGGPARVVSTGASHLLVPVRGRAAVDRTVPDSERLLRALRAAGGEGCYVYAVDDPDAATGTAAYARFFNPTVGIAEDPATGTAAGPLVARLVREGRVADGARAVVEQGTALGRPSRLAVTVTGDRVQLSGSGVLTASGVLHLGD